MDSNRLKLNAEKTKLMVMTTKQKNVHKDLKVFLKGVEVEKVNFAKFLGIIISGNLKWNEYILQSENSLLKYCNKRLAALKLLARDCSLNQRKILAHGLVISKITYCISCSGCPLGTSDLECTGNGKFLYFSFFSAQKSSIYTGNHAISCNFGLK